jgi:adenylate cyclase
VLGATKTYSETFQSVIDNGAILLFFIVGANFFIFLKTTGVETDVFSFNPSREVNILSAHIRVSIGGLLIGTVILIHEKYIHPIVTKGMSFYLKRFIWHLDIAFIILLITFSIVIIADIIEDDYTFSEAFQNALNFITTGLFLSFFIYYYFLSMAVSFLRRLHNTFGQHVFFNYLIGRYSQPIEEKRTFMFLDLNNSTYIAEKLGHVKYSRMLNTCFDDIISSVKGFKFDIYQFVGDEVVFTWLTSEDSNGKAIKLFEAITDGLQAEAQFYESKFGIIPTFKAAVSTGTVSATLVGGKAKNIAYHGDVLNTTARLLGLCKTYNKGILFTDFYLKAASLLKGIETEYVATLKLKGKSNNTNVYSVAYGI